jgi:serine/threonine-protein kinase
MSPEQAAGREVDARSDIFSLGVILYEMVTGERPFGGATTVEVIVAITRDEPEPAAKKNPEVADSVGRVIDRCLRKSPADRFPSAAALAEALDAALSLPAAPRAAHPPRRPVALLVAAIAVAAVAGTYAVTRTGRAMPQAAAPSALQSANAPAPKPTAITDLPLPDSPSVEARAAYRAAVQWMHDSNWQRAAQDLERALSLDPSMAMAHLRLAFIRFNWGNVSEFREHYSRAVGLRSTLGARDQGLLDALEPTLGRPSRDLTESTTRLRVLAERYPFDAELWFLEGMLRVSDATVPALRRAVEIDPTYADALGQLAGILLQTGHPVEAEDAARKCLAASASAGDCHFVLASALDDRGQCAAMSDELEKVIALQMSSTEFPLGCAMAGSTYFYRASAMYADGRAIEAVREMMAAGWTRLPADQRAIAEPIDRARLEYAEGRFDEGDARARELARVVATSDDVTRRSGAAVLLVESALESGRTRDADALSAQYLKTSEILSRGPPVVDPVPFMRSVRLRSGSSSLEAWRSANAEWIRANMPRAQVPPLLWTHAFAWGLDTSEAATAALEELRKIGGEPIPEVWTQETAHIGHAYLLAGRSKDGIRALQLNARLCTRLLFPFTYVRGLLWFGAALEATGDAQGACDEYRAVVVGWGNAKPRSVTAEEARKRAAAIHCNLGR